MNRTTHSGMALVLGLAALCSAVPAQAQIYVGQTSDFSGPAAAGVKENTEGARLWIDHVNARGGIHGQRVELLSLDDKFDPKLAAVNAKVLITEKNVIALFMNRGTPHTEAIRPLLEQHQIPLVAPSTGAMMLHSPVNPWIFNVRAPYQREAEKAVTHLATVGVTEIALVHVDDSFGADAAQGVVAGTDRARLKPVFQAKFDRANPDFKPIVEQVKDKQPQAIFIIGSTAAVAQGAKLIRESGSAAQIVTISNNASGGFIKQMGIHGRGTIVTQVFPYERSVASPIVKEARELARLKGGTGDISPAMIEGYAGAKVLLEGLRQAGPKPTRARLRQALEGFNKVDIGGLEVSYSPTDHSGLRYSDLSIIGPDGKFQR